MTQGRKTLTVLQAIPSLDTGGAERTAIGITGSWTAGINEGCQETVSFSAVAQP